MSKGHVLLGGGTGFVGQALTYLLKRKQYAVTIISRMPGPDRISWFDLSACGLPKGVTSVINLAGQNILEPSQRWTPGFKQNVWNSRVNTNQTLVKAIRSAETKPKVFINMSAVGIYPPDPNILYTEDYKVPASCKADCFLERLVIEWENAARIDTEEVRQATVRSGVVLGRNGGIIQSLYFPFFFYVGGVMGDGCQPFPWIHIKDLCQLFLFLIENDSAKGVFNGVAPQCNTYKDFAKAFGCALGRPYKFKTPAPIVKLIFGSERSRMLLEGQKVMPTRTMETGFQFEYPTLEKALEKESKFFGNKKHPFSVNGQ